MSTHDADETSEILRNLGVEFTNQFKDGDVPVLTLPTRTKSNIVFDEDLDVWVLGDKTTSQSAKTVAGASKLLKKIYTIEFLIQQVDEQRSSTLRELYYLSESWENEYAEFNSQDESNKTVEDLEVVTGHTREDFNMRPEESGATILGPLQIREQTRRGEREIHCQEEVGEGGYQIPSNPESVEFLDHDADFILAVETGGMRDRLVENGFDDEYNCIVVHLKGQPSRSTRRITKRLNDELDLPVLVFTDSDPWSYRIYASVSYGSIKSAHLSEYLATPDAKYLGITPSDIDEYDLPTDKLKDSDVNALESELDDPRFDTEFWREEIQHQLDLGKKAEQQALASQGLDFVTDTYLPDKLEEMGIID